MRSYFFLIFPDRLGLDTGTVFFDKESRKIKIMFFPYKREFNPSYEFRSLIKDIQEICSSKEVTEYTDMFIRYLDDNRSLSELRNRAVMIRREAYLCGFL